MKDMLGRKWLAVLLALLTAFSALPMGAFAELGLILRDECAVDVPKTMQTFMEDVSVGEQMPVTVDVALERTFGAEPIASDVALTPDMLSLVEPDYSAEPIPVYAGMTIRSRSESELNLRLDRNNLDIPSDGMPIPRLYQYDYRFPVCSVDGKSKSVSTSGCGAAAASMLIAYFRQKYNQTPYTLFYGMAWEGRYRGNGLSYETIQNVLADYKIDSRLMETSSEGIVRNLKNGRPIIIKMGPGTFTRNGHYIVLRGLDAEGNVLVNDPNSSWRSTQSYSVELIDRECKGGCMLVAYTEEKGGKNFKEEVLLPIAKDSETEDGRFTEEYDVQVIRENVNLRDVPVDGVVKKSVAEGVTLRVTNEVPGSDGFFWCKVSYEDEEFYIRGDMVMALV